VISISVSRTAETLAWLIAIIYATIPTYWMAVHPFARFWQSRRGKVMPFLGLIWLALWIIAGFATAGYRHQRLWPPWSWIVWVVLFLLGASLYRRLGHFDRAKLLGQAEVRPDEHEQKLITTGLHSRVRHPIYLAHLVMLTAWMIGAGTVALVALWCFAVVTGVFLILFEDRELEARFGEEYRAYKQRVPAVIPMLSPRRHGDTEKLR
jgi:protein-S-isoprenylcysteine O-methyltransferase Ste14